MALDPQVKGELDKFTTAVKAIIYNPDRMKQFLPMLNSANGAIQAVHVIISAIEQKKPIPPQVVPLLGVNAYMLMVDMAQEITGNTPDPAIIKNVIAKIVQSIGQSHAAKEQGMPPEGAETPEAEAAEPMMGQQEEEQAGTEMPMRGGIIGGAIRR